MSREELPKALATWYDYTKWVLDRVDGFPKNQRFVLGTRLADAVVDVMPGPLPRVIPGSRSFWTSAKQGAQASRPRGHRYHSWRTL